MIQFLSQLRLRIDRLEVENGNIRKENDNLRILKIENDNLRKENDSLRILKTENDNLIYSLRNEILELKGKPKKPSPLPKIGEATVSQKELGRGGFGIVYEGMLEGRVVAVKRQKLEENTKKQIQREIEVLW